VKKAFDEYDKDKDGSISLTEAQKFLRQKYNLPSELARKLMRMCDKNNDGQLSYKEFSVFYGKVMEK
jgi:Ca2+-binding EF-hand superfamily protein